jgi:hypothetical protein
VLTGVIIGCCAESLISVNKRRFIIIIIKSEYPHLLYMKFKIVFINYYALDLLKTFYQRACFAFSQRQRTPPLTPPHPGRGILIAGPVFLQRYHPYGIIFLVAFCLCHFVTLLLFLFVIL